MKLFTIIPRGNNNLDKLFKVSLQDCEVNSEDGTVCYERKRSDPSNSDIEGESDNSESSSESLGVAMMLLTLAALNLN